MDDFHTGGFDDAPTQSAAVFRVIFDAVSRLGTRQKIPCALKPPAPLSQMSRPRTGSNNGPEFISRGSPCNLISNIGKMKYISGIRVS